MARKMNFWNLQLRGMGLYIAAHFYSSTSLQASKLSVGVLGSDILGVGYKVDVGGWQTKKEGDSMVDRSVEGLRIELQGYGRTNDFRRMRWYYEQTYIFNKHMKYITREYSTDSIYQSPCHELDLTADPYIIMTRWLAHSKLPNPILQSLLNI
jgi:hypothetical protein